MKFVLAGLAIVLLVAAAIWWAHRVFCIDWHGDTYGEGDE